MTTETILIENEAQWLAERAKDVTSTQVAALFGVSPYLTEFELWHQKRNNVVEEFEQNNRTRWGNRLERTIAEMFAEDYALQELHKLNVYMRRGGLRLGASFDFAAFDISAQMVLVECKNVDFLEWREKWTDTEAPAHIELQVQTQLLLSGYRRAFIVALVGGNTLVVHERTPDAEVQAKIIDKVMGFRLSAEDETAGVDFTQHAETAYAEGVHGHLGTRRPSASSSLTDLLKQPRPDAEEA